MKNARIDGGREMLLIRRGLVEAAADLFEGDGARSRLTKPMLSQRDRLGLRQEDRQAFLIVVIRPVAFGVVHGLDIHVARSQLRIGNLRHRVAAILNRRHQAALAFCTASKAMVPKVRGDQLVGEVRIAAAQIVGQIADDGLLLRSAL